MKKKYIRSFTDVEVILKQKLDVTIEDGFIIPFMKFGSMTLFEIDNMFKFRNCTYTPKQ